MQASQSNWNSLEIVKLLVSTLTPLVVLIVGIWISRRQKSLDELREEQNVLQQKQLDFLQWTNQKVTEKRLDVFEKLAPLLNDLLCYFTYVGCWKDLTPPEVVKRKREMDRIVHVNAALFSTDFVAAYNVFISECYETYTGWGHDAKLRTATERREQAADNWQQEWAECFSQASATSDPISVRRAYESLMTSFATELGIPTAPGHVPSGQIPANIR